MFIESMVFSEFEGVPTTVHLMDCHALPALPLDDVGSITMSSQLPILAAVDIDTEGTTGLDGAVMGTFVCGTDL